MQIAVLIGGDRPAPPRNHFCNWLAATLCSGRFCSTSEGLSQLTCPDENRRFTNLHLDPAGQRLSTFPVWAHRRPASCARRDRRRPRLPPDSMCAAHLAPLPSATMRRRFARRAWPRVDTRSNKASPPHARPSHEPIIPQRSIQLAHRIKRRFGLEISRDARGAVQLGLVLVVEKIEICAFEPR